MCDCSKFKLSCLIMLNFEIPWFDLANFFSGRYATSFTRISHSASLFSCMRHIPHSLGHQRIMIGICPFTMYCSHHFQ